MSDYVMFLLIPQVSVADERMLDMHGPLTSTMEIEMLCRKVLKRIQYSTYKILLPTSVSLSQLNALNPLVFEMLKQPPVVLWPKGSWYPQGTPPKKRSIPSRPVPNEQGICKIQPVSLGSSYQGEGDEVDETSIEFFW